MNNDLSSRSGDGSVQTFFLVFDHGSKSWVKKPTRMHAGLHGIKQALMALVADVESFPSGHVVDPINITTLVIAAELLFQFIDELNTLAGEAVC